VVAALAVAIAGTGATAAHAAPSSRDLKTKIAKASADLETITESYNKMNISLNKTIADQKALAASLGPARAALKVATVQVGSIAASAYKTGQVGTMNVLLDGPNGLMERMTILDQMSRSRQRDIATFTATTQNYADRQAALKITQDKQAAEVKAITARKTKIENDLKQLYAMRTAAYGRATEKSSRYSGSIPSVSGSAGVAVRYAYNALGSPYVYGSDGPNTFDCSGLTMAAWRAAGKSLPHNAAMQWNTVSHISRSQLAPGDLVFYSGLGHVALFVGGGQVIHAPHAGTVVKKVSVDIESIVGYGRV
jgi:cell wall-associated NlpC family hydrolase